MTIDLSLYTKTRVEKSSSKGNQAKWHIGDIWYKADFLGYEALAEYVVSDMLRHSNIREFCEYDLISIRYRDQVFTGCQSRDFLKVGEDLVTLEKLGKLYRDMSIGSYLSGPGFAEDRIEAVLSFLDAVGVNGAGQYLTALIELDALTLNNDRHTNNIAFLRRNNDIIPAPVFDNGAAFLSNTGEFSLSRPARQLADTVDAKPFSTSFRVQKQEMERRYGIVFQCGYSKKQLRTALDYAAGYYRDQVLKRVEEVAISQMERYPEFVQNPL